MSQVTDQQMKDAVDKYLTCLNDSDLEGIIGLYADDATVEDPVGRGVVKGKEALRVFYQRATAAKVTAELMGDIRCAGGEVAFPFKVTNNMGAKPLVIEIIDTFKFNEVGEITQMRAFWGMTNCSGDLSIFSQQ